ncbi:hypothetical protein [Novispirillum itersonii]
MKLRDAAGSVVVNGGNTGIINLGGLQAKTFPLQIFLPADTAAAKNDNANRFTYTARRTEFLGRDAEMQQLQDFLTSPAPFRWWLMTGQGGVGKSRLALEFCRAATAKKHPPARPAALSWLRALLGGKDRPGQGRQTGTARTATASQPWTSGFLLLDEAHKQTDAAQLAACVDPLQHWQPESPTLIVVDYVGERPKYLGMVIRTLAMRKDLAHPVRLLLLERDADGLWRQAFDASDAPGRNLMDQTRHADPLALTRPDEDALWAILSTMSNGQAKDRTDLLGQLKEIDPHCRPLFAAFLGDALAGSGPSRRWDRAALLKDVLKRNETHFWTPNGITEADKLLLCLATLTSGAFADWLNTPALTAPDFPDPLPSLQDPGLQERYRTMTGSDIQNIAGPLGRRSLFPALQPDLLGEFFVLQYLAPPGTMREAWSPRLQAVLKAAWHLAPVGTAVFLDRLGTDFPDAPDLHDFFAMPESDVIEVQRYWAMVAINEGTRLGRRGENTASIAVYDEVISRFADAPETALRELLATAMVNKAVCLSESDDSTAAIDLYNDVIRRFANAPEPALRGPLAKAMVNKAVRLGKSGDSEAEIAVYDEVIRRFGDATEPALREQLAKAMVYKAITIGQSGDSKAEIAVYDEVIRRFGDATEPALREQLAKAMVYKAITIGQSGDSKAEIAVYDEVIRRFGDATEPALREQLAKAMVNKAVTIGQSGDSEAEIAVYDEVIRRFGDATEPALREQLAKAMVYKAITIGQSGDSKAEIAVYDEVIRRFGDAPEPDLQKVVGLAREFIQEMTSEQQAG